MRCPSCSTKGFGSSGSYEGAAFPRPGEFFLIAHLGFDSLFIDCGLEYVHAYAFRNHMDR